MEVLFLKKILYGSNNNYLTIKNLILNIIMNKILLILFCCTSSAIIAQSNTKIFNGKDLTGWTIHGTEKWYVDKGELVCESGPDKQYGYLSTDKNYKDFILTLKFKQEANGNSGVFFRSGIEGVKISGWQVEVAPKDHFTAGIYESYGRGWLIKPKAENEKILKPGKWNTLKIKVIGDEVTTWLNGHWMVFFKDEKIGKGEGFIALQIHDGGGIKVRWKDFKMKEIE